MELECDGQRLVLDIGLPLDADLDADLPLPAVVGLEDGDPSLVGVVISHAHPDHYGFASRIDRSIPLYLGAATQRILKAAMPFTRAGADLSARGYLDNETPLEIGPFTLTPYLVDHSAFDAYALMIDGGGRRLFYSGDLRAHGRKRGLFERLVKGPPAHVNALLLEGTNLRIAAHASSGLTEFQLEDRLVDAFRATRGMMLVGCSGQNVDRLVTLHKAALRSQRTLVIDLYSAAVARATGRTGSIPQGDWGNIWVYVPDWQAARAEDAGEGALLDEVRLRRLSEKDLAARSGELVLTFRGSMMHDLDHAGCLDGAGFVWSMWPGYLDEPSGRKLQAWLKRRGIPIMVLHSSGHATPGDLSRLAAALDADQVVPIHTARPDLYSSLFRNVVSHPDEEWWSV